jgi:phenylpropionate dioxygenase-like ring-hydroxylating dioxygenase large terminal subunit
MLTREENELLTRVGAGTPAGELLRRYWHPVAVARELTEENPTKFVRILGEDLTLFRDNKGRVGLLADRCAHRGASLAYGRVEERGLACAYHGWLYDVDGNCLECPAEPVGSKFHLTVKQKAYPVKRYFGFYWAYMGPAPAPLIPKFDIWARKDGAQSSDPDAADGRLQLLQPFDDHLAVAPIRFAHVARPFLHGEPAQFRGSRDGRDLAVQRKNRGNVGVAAAAAVGQVARVRLKVGRVAAVVRGDDDVDALAGHQLADRPPPAVPLGEGKARVGIKFRH